MIDPIIANIEQQDADYIKNFHKKFINTYGQRWPAITPDQSAIINILRVYDIKSFCEIGTWEGYTSLAMWLYPTIERGVAMDICSNFSGGGNEYHKDLDKYGRYFRYITPVNLIEADSLTYQQTKDDFYDLVFIDGNHSYDYVKSDFALASKMAKNIIAFHDYSNGNGGVDKFIEEVAGKIDIYWYEGSAVVYIKVEDLAK